MLFLILAFCGAIKYLLLLLMGYNTPLMILCHFWNILIAVIFSVLSLLASIAIVTKIPIATKYNWPIYKNNVWQYVTSHAVLLTWLCCCQACFSVGADLMEIRNYFKFWLIWMNLYDLVHFHTICSHPRLCSGVGLGVDLQFLYDSHCTNSSPPRNSYLFCEIRLVFFCSCSGAEERIVMNYQTKTLLKVP